MSDTIVIYHGGCRDGFAAAWVVNKYFKSVNRKDVDRSVTGEPTYVPGFYGQEPPDVKGKDVIIVDFCYPIEVMTKIAEECNKLIWLDHHKTAEPWAHKLFSMAPAMFVFPGFLYDNNRSGAGLAWDYFFPDQPRPWLVDYVEDRDLWAKALDNSDIINAWIACLEFDFRIWDAQVDLDLETIISRGLTAQLKTEQYVKEVCKNVYRVNLYKPDFPVVGSVGRVKWPEIPIVNICQIDCSEVLHELCKRYPESPFSLYWFKRADGLYQYGIRSIGDFDCSTVAKLFGGGGHKNAAGFQLPYLLPELS